MGDYKNLNYLNLSRTLE